MTDDAYWPGAAPPAFKWPRTYHHPISRSLQNDDRRLPDTTAFFDADGRPKRVIVAEKMDGENFTMTRETCHPRSADGRYHPSRDLARRYHAERAHHIPEDWRISGEYMLAVHAIEYSRANGNALSSPFYAFGVWNGTDTLLAWDDMLEILEILDIPPVPVLHDGPYDEAVLAKLLADLDEQRSEGFVVRVAEAIARPSGPGDAGRFWRGFAKIVRANHVAGNEHWASGRWFRNEIDA